jgi:hypothetical protein
VGDGKTPSYDPAPTHTSNNLVFANYGGSQGFDNDDGSSFYYTHDNVFYSADGFKMDYGGHDSRFYRNVIITLPYDSQNCFNVGGFKDGHGDQIYENHCFIYNGCRHPEKYGCDDVATVSQCSKGSPLLMHDNNYYTTHGNASVKCQGGAMHPTCRTCTGWM